jgi:4-amino-4-deoxy-L-arabinose transferase-like glycosyltransferase
MASALPFLFFYLGRVELLDPDEGLYAAIASEMLVTGEWIIPHFNGLPYLEKPPLYFWLTAISMMIFGFSELAVRLWSALPALGSALLTWRIGDLLYGKRAGLVSALIFVSCAGIILYVRKASTDFLLVFSITLAMYGFIRDSLLERKSPTGFLLVYLGAALGLLSKGLIALVFPTLTICLSVWWLKSVRLRELNLARGLTLFAVIVLPWHVVAAWRNLDHFWFYLVDNQILRFLNLRAFIEDDVQISALGFLIVSFIWLFPWGMFLFYRRTYVGLFSPPERVALPIWALVVVGFFLLSRSRLEYYMLPAFPALAVLIGGLWTGGHNLLPILRVAAILCTVAGMIFLWLGENLTPSLALFGLAELNVYYRIVRDQGLAFPFSSAQEFGTLLQWLGSVLIVGWGLALLAWSRGSAALSFSSLFVTAGVIGILIVKLLYLIEPHHSTKTVSQVISASSRDDDVIIHEGSLEYSAALPFYTGRRVVVFDGQRGDLDFASRLPEAKGWFLDREQLFNIWQGPRRVFFVTPREPRASVVADLPRNEVHLIGHYNSRRLYSNR